MLAIDNTHLLLAGSRGIFKSFRNEVIKEFYNKKSVYSLCHVTDSLYLVGFHADGLILWNEQTDQEVSKICDDTVFSIRRVMTTNSYVIKTLKNGLKIVTI
jgi:hypothetical protein